MAALATRAKKQIKQTANESKQHVDACLAKIRGQTWSEPLGQACSVTGGIMTGLGTFVPGVGMLGGALSLGGTLLNPKATMNDVRRELATRCIFCSPFLQFSIYDQISTFKGNEKIHPV